MSFACAPRIVKHRISRTKTLHTPFQPLQIQKIDNFTRTGSRTPSRRLHNTGRREHHFKFSHPHVSQLTANRHAIVCSAAREEIISPSKRYAVPPEIYPFHGRGPLARGYFLHQGQGCKIRDRMQKSEYLFRTAWHPSYPEACLRLGYSFTFKLTFNTFSTGFPRQL